MMTFNSCSSTRACRRSISLVLLLIGAMARSGAAFAAEDLKIGALLPLSQMMSVYGIGLRDGMQLAIEEAGGSVAGRKILLLSQDDKNDPKFALQLVRQFTKDEKVDFLVGPIASHIAQAIRDEVHRSRTFLLLTAGNDELTRELCSPYIVRLSHSNWQLNEPLGDYTADHIGKRAALVGLNFTASKQMGSAFRSGFTAKGGKVLEEVWPAMNTADFSNVFTKLQSMESQVDVVWSFIPGSAAVNYVNQYAESRLKSKNVGPQSNADDYFFGAMQDNAIGIIGAGHYVASLDTPRNNQFRAAFLKRYSRAPGEVEVRGYDAANMIIAVARSLNGDTSDRQAVRRAMTDVDVNSPRGYFRIDPTNGNVIQNVYITKVAKRGNAYTHEILKTYERVRDTDSTCKLNW